MIKYIHLFFLFYIYSFDACASTCPESPRWISESCQGIVHIFSDGHLDLYLSGYAWHNRYMYDSQRVKHYNEEAWGGGFGKSLFDAKGNWHSLAIIAFLDSHAKWEPTAGYTYLKVADLSPTMKIGGGLSVIVTARSDLNNGYPFPGVLPWVSFFYRQFALSATYIPGPRNNGNVLYILGKIAFDI